MNNKRYSSENKMATAEDVYWLYEHKIDINNQIVFPTLIGDNEVSCNLKRKTYILPGQECPICMDAILRKSDAYLTSCGHGFHKKCIFDAFQTKIEKDCYSVFRCPMCRTTVGDICIQGKYNEFNTNFNSFDILENFWKNKEYGVTLCVLCEDSNIDSTHYQGMKKDCETCLKYRQQM